MAQLPHFESDSSTHEGEGMVTATEGEWVVRLTICTAGVTASSAPLSRQQCVFRNITGTP